MADNTQNDVNEILDSIPMDDEAIANAGVAESKNAQIQPGKAIVWFENTFLQKTQTSGQAQLVSVVKVLEHVKDPKAVGRSHYHSRMVVSQKNFEFLNLELQNLQMKIVSGKQDLLRVCNELRNIAATVWFAASKDQNYPQPNMFINPNARRMDITNPDEFLQKSPQAQANAAEGLPTNF